MAKFPTKCAGDTISTLESKRIFKPSMPRISKAQQKCLKHKTLSFNLEVTSYNEKFRFFFYLQRQNFVLLVRHGKTSSGVV